MGRLAERVGLDPADEGRGLPWTTRDLVNELRKRGVIDPSLARVIRDLQDARNVAAHARPYTVEPDEVMEYVKLAGRVRDALLEAQERLGNEVSEQTHGRGR